MHVMLNRFADDNNDANEEEELSHIVHRVEENELSGDDGVWDFPGHDDTLDSLGIVIVQGEEHEPETKAAQPPPVDDDHTNLSLPDSIDVPSEVRSLHDLTHFNSEGSGDRNEQDHERNRLRFGRAVIWSKLGLVVLVVLLAVSLLSSVYLVWERQSLSHATLRLEERILQLEKRLERETKDEEQTPPPVPHATPPVLTWEDTCEDNASSKDQTVLLDNCWLQAKAKFELGSCASEAQQSAKETIKGLGKSIKNSNKHFWNKVDDLVDDLGKTWVDYMAEMTNDDTLDAANSNEDTDDINKANGEGALGSVGKAVDSRAKTIVDTATTVVSSIAFLSLAAFVVDGTMSFLGSSPSNTAADANFV